ncbi:MAG: hypothetical protein J0M04_07640 [Verrucomicrobia bacterium]|nr:hypothetical protein [Verrucomicrobiota bacterium]
MKGFSTETRFLDQIVVKKGTQVFRFVDIREAYAAVVSDTSKSKDEPNADGTKATVEYVIATNRIAAFPFNVGGNTGDAPKLAALLYDPNVKLFVALRDTSGKPGGKSQEITIPLVTDLQKNE